VFETNVTGVLGVCRRALPLLRKGERPVVVNVSSILGRRGVPGQSVYCASKAALCSIGEALRIEWAGDSIAVCTLEPGLTKTNIFDAQPNPSHLPHPSMAAADTAADVARAILALDRKPQPELSLRRKWRWLAVLNVLAPRLADKLLVRNIGGGWQTPRR
jgi:NAD(P)-dependent dehydrogenase (short-subunit alcohol dehydrogenase family)